jgi:hypothetical protein
VQKAKAISQALNLALIEVAKEVGATSMEKAYRNAWYCQNIIITAVTGCTRHYVKTGFVPTVQASGKLN